MGFVLQTCFGEKRGYEPQNKSKTPCEDAAETGKRMSLCPLPTWTERSLIKEEAITPKAT